MSVQDVLINGCQWRVGNGLKIDLYKDKWIDGLHGIGVGQRQDTKPVLVSKLIDRGRGEWRVERMQELNIPQDVTDHILDISLPMFDIYDGIQWTLEDSGEYTVKSTYKFMRLEPYSWLHKDI